MVEHLSYIHANLAQHSASSTSFLPAVEASKTAAMVLFPPPYQENGRWYHGWRARLYMYPCDEDEKERLDIWHAMSLEARSRELHRAPLISNGRPPRILDLGCGTGIWAVDMAERYPHAEILGIDLVDIQPTQNPNNLRFRVPKDFESPWTFGNDSFDFIRLGLGCGSVSSWPALYEKVFQHLARGTGRFEQVEVDFRPRCDDDTLPTWPIVDWFDCLEHATRIANRPIAYSHDTRRMLQDQGFVDVEEVVIRLPFWGSDRDTDSVGRWYNLGLTDAIEALSLGPLHRYSDWSVDEIRRIVREVRTAICRPNEHGYNNLHVITARKPSPLEIRALVPPTPTSYMPGPRVESSQQSGRL